MMLDTIPNHRLVHRKILFAELAFIERGTNLLFVPLLDEVWRDQTTGQMKRILSNKLRRVNMKSQDFKDTFIPVRLSWQTLFSANPATMVIER
jgi:hypothetical protein